MCNSQLQGKYVEVDYGEEWWLGWIERQEGAQLLIQVRIYRRGCIHHLIEVWQWSNGEVEIVDDLEPQDYRVVHPTPHRIVELAINQLVTSVEDNFVQATQDNESVTLVDARQSSTEAPVTSEILASSDQVATNQPVATVEVNSMERTQEYCDALVGDV